ncbi:MAG: hypothetical protein AAF170_18230 [Bacteroidota bacterium]
MIDVLNSPFGLLVAGSILGGLGYVARHGWKEFMDRRGQRQARDVTEAQSAIYTTLARLQGATSADRVLILNTQNGGGIPRADGPTFSSVLYEETAPNVPPVQGDWQKEQLDSQYAHLINEVVQNGAWEGPPERLTPEAGKLFDAYKAMNVVYSYVVLVKLTSGKVYYLSVTWRQEHAPTKTTPTIRNAVRAAVTEIREQL